MLNGVINFLFPPLCVHCQAEGDWFCRAARRELEQEPVLVDPVAITGVTHAYARGRYDCDPLASIIQSIKYRYWHAAGAVINDLLKPVVDAIEIQPGTVIVPVPLHRRRMMERGFNQSAIIARALNEFTGLPIQHLIVRHRYTTPQAKLKEHQRLSNMTDAFSAAPNVAKWPKSVIIVDDVMTTGSTLRECAVVLRHHGVDKIFVIALAKG
jgi:ComF family protein